MVYQYRGTIRDAFEPEAPPKCGSRAGYMEHVRRDTEKCQPCKDAQNAYMRAYRRRPKMRNTCGTYPGYMRHRRSGEDACDMCRAGYAQYMRNYRERKQAA